MRFVSFSYSNQIHLGVLHGGGVVDLTRVLDLLPRTIVRRTAVHPWSSMEAYLRAWDVIGTELDVATADVVSRASEVLPISVVQLVAPIAEPNSLRDGYAFRQHVETMRRNRGVEMIPEFDLFPVFYFGNHRSIFGPGKFPVQRLHLDRLDYELELAIVIGKRGRNIRAESADRHIFGLTIMNDMSARALQTEEMKLSLGPAKGKDFGTVLGPTIVTPDELRQYSTSSSRGIRYSLNMSASVNGRQLSSGNSGDMHWTFAEIIERASYGVWLEPGDVIGSGTVGTGCLAELNSSGTTNNLWLKDGDVIALDIEGIGTLESKIEEVPESEVSQR